MNKNHVVRVMNHAGMAQRTNSGDLVGMYTLNQMAEVLALHDHVMAAERVAAVPLTNINAELQTAKEEIAYLKQQCEKSNQQGILAAKERDDANGMVERQATNIEELLRDNEALKAQAASAESERDINYRNWQTAQYEVAVAAKTMTIVRTERDFAILERDKLRGSIGNLETSFNSNAIAHSNCLREIEVLKSQLADVTAAWQDAGRMKASFAANYRAAHNEMQRQERRAVDAETELASVKAQQQFQGKT